MPTLSPHSFNFYIAPPLIIPILPCRVAWPDDDPAEHFVDIKIGIVTVGLLTQGIDRIERRACQSLCSHRCSASSSRNIPFLSTTIYRKLSKLLVSMLLRHPRFPSILQLVYPLMASTDSLRCLNCSRAAGSSTPNFLQRLL